LKYGSGNSILTILSVLLACTLCFSIFGNIAYPLLWNDEAETALYAKQILTFGYPKVHDGKNVIYLIWDGMSVCYKYKYDAYIGSVWGQYYYCAFGAWLAKRFDNVYIKTALLRIPFALAGFFGIFITALLAIPLFNKLSDKLLYFSVFILIEISSVYLALHVREVRYYSLALLISAILIFIYARRRIFQTMHHAPYWVCMISFSLMLFNVFYPALIALWTGILLYECFRLAIALSSSYKTGCALFKSEVLTTFKICLPLLVSFLLLLPAIRFYNMINVVKFYSYNAPFSFTKYLANISRILDYFAANELLYSVIIIKALMMLLRVLLHGRPDGLQQKTMVSDMLTCVFVASLLFIAKMSWIYERYYIWAQPFLAAFLALDIFIIIEIVRLRFRSFKYGGTFVAALVSALLIINSRNMLKTLSNHFYEISHHYKGPLDYVIPYLQSSYKHPEDLVVATNYEEHCFMYYLGCKVVIGFVCNNLERDVAEIPDIIWIRNSWDGFSDESYKIFGKYLDNNTHYHKKTFPIANARFNTIAESKDHGFYTQSASMNDSNAVQIWEYGPRRIE
jgi:hypothetical protein